MYFKQLISRDKNLFTVQDRHGGNLHLQTTVIYYYCDTFLLQQLFEVDQLVWNLETKLVIDTI